MDWADREARQIMVLAFLPEAQARIAAALRSIKFDGVKIGLLQAQKIFNEAATGRELPVDEAVERIKNACGQM